MGQAAERWSELDEPWRTAFAMAWEAVTTGNIGVGAVVTDPGGRILAQARNRVADVDAPAGQVAGSSVAHAEINALASLSFRAPRALVLTTTLQPCLQCAAAIRMGPIAHVRIAGGDPLWDGCDDFSPLNDWVARRAPVPAEGPRRDEVGTFGTLLARFGTGMRPHVEDGLRARGESPVIDLVRRLEAAGVLERAATRPVQDLFVELWPDLVDVSAERWPT